MIDKIKHYAINTPTFPSVYDQESMTALELVGRLGGTVNECVDVVNAGSAKLDTYEQRLADAEGRSIIAEETALNAIVAANSARNVADGASSTAAGAAATAASAETIARAASTSAGEAGATALEAQRRAHNAELSALDAGGLASSAATAAINAGDAAAEAKAEALSASTAAAGVADELSSFKAQGNRFVYHMADTAFIDHKQIPHSLLSPIFRLDFTMWIQRTTAFNPYFMIEIHDAESSDRIAYSVEMIGSTGKVRFNDTTEYTIPHNIPQHKEYCIVCSFEMRADKSAVLTFSFDSIISYTFSDYNPEFADFDAEVFDINGDIAKPVQIRVTNNETSASRMCSAISYPFGGKHTLFPTGNAAVGQVAHTCPDIIPLYDLNSLRSDLVSSIDDAYNNLGQVLRAGCIPKSVILMTPDRVIPTDELPDEDTAIVHLAETCEEHHIPLYCTVPVAHTEGAAPLAKITGRYTPISLDSMPESFKAEILPSGFYNDYTPVQFTLGKIIQEVV